MDGMSAGVFITSTPDSLETSNQRLRLKGLGDVVVCAKLKALDALALKLFAGHQNDGDVGCESQPFQAAEMVSFE